jgi:hypothetical protein
MSSSSMSAVCSDCLGIFARSCALFGFFLGILFRFPYQISNDNNMAVIVKKDTKNTNIFIAIVRRDPVVDGDVADDDDNFVVEAVF